MDNHIAWAIDILNHYGYQVQTSIPEVVQHTPWSDVDRFKTNHGDFYLKKVPTAISIESKIINILYKEFHASVPKIIADNHELHCFLMQDAGIRLFDSFKENFRADILIQAVQNYIKLQQMTTDKVERFIDIGVPDWRLSRLPTLYRDLIANDSLLIGDGLNKDELVKLQGLESKLISLCDNLSHYNIKETFGHADFHDKNILINPDSSQTTLIDLGEVVITHPFFSLHNCLHRAKENFSLSNTQYQQLQKACLKPWLELETEEHLIEIFTIIQQCWSIHSVLGELRLMNSVDPSVFQKLSRQGRLANSLRYWIAHDVA